jgi:predicted RNA-binding Zn-ribbon protein involved in translation (DUF1610 family)
MILTCSSCRGKFDESELEEDDSNLICPDCGNIIANVSTQDRTVGISEGIDVPEQYQVGYRKLKTFDDDPIKDMDPTEEDNNSIIELAKKVEDELGNPEDSEDWERIESECSKQKEVNILRTLIEYKEDLVSRKLNKDIINKLVLEKEADLRFNITKAVQSLELAHDWFSIHDQDEDEYSILGLFSKFN